MKNSTSSDGAWYQVKNVDDVPSPALLVYPDRIEENILRMIGIAGSPDRLRPHVKTHKMAAVTDLHIRNGITRFKCATVAEAEMVAAQGAGDIILAIQPVGPNVERFFRLMSGFPDTQFSCIADSENVVKRLSEMAVETGRETNVWLDINNGMDRTGIWPGEAAFDLARKISVMPMLKLIGVHLYDGHITDGDFSEREKRCNDSFKPVANLLDRLAATGITGLKTVAGGTSTFPIHARRKNTECSPGTTALWDYGYGSRFTDLDFLHAAVLLTRIISKPAEGLICTDLGHKAVASEMPQPRIRLFGLENYEIVTHSEEHMVIRTARAAKMKTGDILYGVPWHICPTTDRYDSVYVVRENRVTETWRVTARNRIISSDPILK